VINVRDDAKITNVFHTQRSSSFLSSGKVREYFEGISAKKEASIGNLMASGKMEVPLESSTIFGKD
jgi:hypothetical protein